MRKLIKLKLLFVLCLSLSAITLNAQEQLADNRGTDFWVMFNTNGNDQTSGGQSNRFFLFLTGEVGTSGSVDVPGLAFSENFTIIPGTVISIELPSNVEMMTSDGIENKAVHITSMNDIVVHGINQLSASTDAFMGIPSDVLGTEHIIAAYEGASQNFFDDRESSIGIVAAENNTTVTITPSVSTRQYTADIPYTITLNMGEAYQLLSENADDLTGTIIESDKPVGVYGGHNCVNIPDSFLFCDHIIEQFPSVDKWGQQFYTASLATRIAGDIFRIVGSVDNTAIAINGMPEATINRGEYFETVLPSNSFNEITANNPILVVQYSQSTSVDNVNSDPFMMFIPPFEQFNGSTVFSTPTFNLPINFVNIVTPLAGVGAIAVDEVLIPVADYEQIGTSDFFGVRVQISVGSHSVQGGNVPFGAFVYGFGEADSYGYPAGAVFSPVALVEVLEVTPPTASIAVGEQHCVTATLTDQFDNPLVGVRVDFVVSGVNNQSGFIFTDMNGEAIYCYTGTAEGTDNITATTGDLSGTVEAIWTDVIIMGCTDSNACNYNPDATMDDGSCITCDTSGETTTQACDDGNPCTTNDEEVILTCNGSVCVPCSGTLDEASCDEACTMAQACDDGDDTTIDDMEVVAADGSICVPCTGMMTTCEDGPTTPMVCDDGNPCTVDDVEIILGSSGPVCVPCAGTPVDCDSGQTTTQACDDGDSDTENDMETILTCDGSICVPCQGEPIMSECTISSAMVETYCDDNGTDILSDDTFYFTVNPMGTNMTGTTYSISGDVSESGISYGAPSMQFGPFAVGTSLSITITDDSDSDCSFLTTVSSNCTADIVPTLSEWGLIILALLLLNLGVLYIRQTEGIVIIKE